MNNCQKAASQAKEIHCETNDVSLAAVRHEIAHETGAKHSVLEPSVHTPASLREKYQFIDEIGHGSQATVYRAIRIADGTIVTVKQLNIESVKTWKEYDLFSREAEVLSKLHIPGVAKFYEAIECLDDNPPCSYIVQEFIEGASLAQMLAQSHRFTAEEAYDIILQMIDILIALQQRKEPIIHRDIKPSNIMITPGADGYRVTLIDFGAVANPQIQSGGSTVAGTYGYMPPEQLMGRPVPASDIYALGAVAVELFSGKSPALMPNKDFRLIFEPDVEQLPAPVVATLRQMLQPNVENRISNLRDLRKAFQKYKTADYCFDNIKNLDKDDDADTNQKLALVSSVGEPGNMELWQRLSESLPRKIPKYYIDAIGGNYDILKKRRRIQMLIRNKWILWFLAAAILLIIVIAAGRHPVLVSFGLFGCLLMILNGVSAVSASHCGTTPVNQRTRVARIKNSVVYDIIAKGRKTVATITDIEYIPIQNALVDTDRLSTTNDPPAFRIKYKFNPPDDLRSEDLIHEYISHEAPEHAYKIGDPLPILYKIEPLFFGDSVYSMPYPFPTEEALNDEVVYKSSTFVLTPQRTNLVVDNYVHNSYDYKTYYYPFITYCKNNSSPQAIISFLNDSLWIIESTDVLKLLINYFIPIIKSNHSKVRSAFVICLIKIYHYAKIEETASCAIDFVTNLFNSDEVTFNSAELLDICKVVYKYELPASCLKALGCEIRRAKMTPNERAELLMLIQRSEKPSIQNYLGFDSKGRWVGTERDN